MFSRASGPEATNETQYQAGATGLIWIGLNHLSLHYCAPGENKKTTRAATRTGKMDVKKLTSVAFPSVEAKQVWQPLAFAPWLSTMKKPRGAATNPKMLPNGAEKVCAA